ncbi:SLC13 family permease [Agilicoccus flavus]|uniref:SLC13 family permease n=1 Tax=Agilicoccus flavus TaxID=2775968 RepID=UPI001CF62418|nr:DASS family sodium-coupled anion symporter [Agilicoccus flavus]
MATDSPTQRSREGWTDVEAVLLGNRDALGSERLSDTEERVERIRQTSGWFLAPLVAIVFFFLPLGMDGTQQTLAAVLLGVIVLWITEPVPIPIGGLIGVAAIVFLGVAKAADVLKPFGSTTVFTFIGAFILAQAMMQHGVARRIAFWLLGLPGVGKTTMRVLLAFGGVTCLLSAFVSNTATVAMLLPTAIGIVAVIARLLQERGLVEPGFDPTKLRIATAFMLMLAYSASVGGLLTPVGSPPNLIGRGLIEEATGKTIDFGQWFAIAFPICAVMFVALAIILTLINKPEVRKLEGVGEYLAEQKRHLGPLSRAERNTIIAFTFTVVGWLLPSILNVILGDDHAVAEAVAGRLNEGIVAVAGACLLFMLPVDWSERRFTMSWEEAAKIDWGTIILFGTGIIFGALLDDTGLAETIGKGAASTFGVTTPFALTVFAVLLAILISETTSNTAAAAVTVPIIIPLATAAGLDPFVPALAATFGASFGFMLPVSTPQNAIVYGSGVVPITRMIRSGISFDIIGAILIIIFLPIVAGLVGLV